MNCCPRYSIIPSRNRVASNTVTSSRSLNMRGRIEDISKASEFQTAAQPLNLTVESVESLQIYLSTYFPWLKLCIYKVKPALMSRFLHFKAVKKNLIQPRAIYVFKLFWDYISWHGKTSQCKMQQEHHLKVRMTMRDIRYPNTSWCKWVSSHRNCPYCPCTSVRAKSLQSCPALCDPIDNNLAGSSVCGILQARILEWVAVPSSRRSSQTRDQTQVSYVCIDRQVPYH